MDPNLDTLYAWIIVYNSQSDKDGCENSQIKLRITNMRQY